MGCRNEHRDVARPNPDDDIAAQAQRGLRAQQTPTRQFPPTVIKPQVGTVS